MNDEIKYFLTKEWVESAHDFINQSEDYEKAAKTWEGDILFVVTDIPDNVKEKIGGYEKIGFWLDLYHGKSRDFKYVEDPDSFEATYKIIATYDNWKKVLKGELNPVRGMMTRKLKVKGNLAKILRYTNAALALLKAVQKIPTKFLDEE